MAPKPKRQDPNPDIPEKNRPDPDHPFGQDNRDHDRPADAPWLLIRAYPTDIGSRPLTPNTPFWVSPDITMSPTNAWGQAEAGQDVTITATVQNLGLSPATSVQATFWWADPSVGVTPALAHKIGVSVPVTIGAGLMASLDCFDPWTPQYLNGGHECLVAEVSCLYDQVQASFRPDLDRHVGQRNVHVADSTETTHPMMLTIANPFDVEGVTRIFAETMHVTGVPTLAHAGPLTLSELYLHARDPFVGRLLGRAGLRARKADPGGGLTVGKPKRQRGEAGGYGETALAELWPNRYTPGKLVGELTMAPGGTATIEIAPSPGSDTTVVHHIRQETNGVDVGGYTILVPSEVLQGLTRGGRRSAEVR